MSYEIIGFLHEKMEVQQISEHFTKREFVLEHIVKRNDRKIIDHIKFQLTGDRCSLIEEIDTGQEIKVQFNIKGRKFERDGNTTYFTNLDAWKIEASGNSLSDMSNDPQANDYLPF